MLTCHNFTSCSASLTTTEDNTYEIDLFLAAAFGGAGTSTSLVHPLAVNGRTLPSLTSLDLSEHWRITAAGVSFIISGFPSLVKLKLSSCVNGVSDFQSSFFWSGFYRSGSEWGVSKYELQRLTPSKLVVIASPRRGVKAAVAGGRADHRAKMFEERQSGRAAWPPTSDARAAMEEETKLMEQREGEK